MFLGCQLLFPGNSLPAPVGSKRSVDSVKAKDHGSSESLTESQFQSSWLPSGVRVTSFSITTVRCQDSTEGPDLDPGR
jgi:hypothetical protein